MALTLASSGATVFNNATTPKTATVSWAAGDIIVVKAASESGNTVLGTPTATGLTFTLRADEGSTSSSEGSAAIYSATAAASGSGVTVSQAWSGSSGHTGFHWSVWSGASGVTGGTGNLTEGTTSLTTAAGDAVVAILADWNATTPFTRTAATGSGTATEEVETTTGQYSVWAGRWEGTSATTAGYGLTSYTSLKTASAFLVITAAAGATDYTKTPADPAGVTDARTVVRTVARTASDTVGVADTAARTMAAARTVANPVGVTDSVSAVVARARTLADPAGVADSAARTAAVARTVANPVGIADAAVAQLGQAVANPVGVSDSVTAVVATVRTLADPVGITDTAAPESTGSHLELLNVYALASADPHNITITGATAGLDLWLLVNTPAVVTTPAGWTVEASRIDAMGSYVLHLPGESNPGGSVGVTLDISAARALAAVAFQAPADDASVYASLVAQVNGPGSTAWGTGAHTFAARDDAVAVFMFHEDLSGAPASFSASSYDHGFAAFADSGWAGAGSTGNEAVRVVVGSATAVGFAADGVTLTLTAAGPTGSAMGFVAFDLDTGLLAVKADPIGITDTVARTAATARTVADAAGVTDARTVAASAARTAADPVGITDSVSAVLGQLVADQVGVTDTVAVARTSARTVANPVGVTDSVSANLTGGSTNYTRTPADPVGVTDSAARAVAYVRTVADAVGVTDTGSPQTIDIGYTLADPAGVTDAAARAVAAVRARNDAVGIVDSASSSLSGGGGTNYTRTPADPVGITDARTVARTLPRSPADAVGVADAAVRVLARARTQADAVGLVDTVLVVRTTARTLANPVGITDTAYVPGAAPPWSWLVSTGAGLAEHTPLLDGVHPSTATIT